MGAVGGSPAGPDRLAGERLLSLVPVWLGVTVLAFAVAGLAPGDPAEMILLRRTGEVPGAAEVEALRREMGLDAPAPVRYARWLGDVVRGDLGTSYRTGEPVLELLASRFLATLELAGAALLLALVVALPIGILSAVRRGGTLDHLSRGAALLGASLPGFWLGYLLILLFAVELGLLPVAGRGGWPHLVLPAATLALGMGAKLTRLTRAVVLDELRMDYVLTARAKGLPEWLVVGRHALRNALNPLVTLSGTEFGKLLGGAVVVEVVFAWPGIGSAVVDSIHDRDFPTIQGFVLFMGTVFVLVNLLVDLSYGWLDPRVRPGGSPEASGG